MSNILKQRRKNYFYLLKSKVSGKEKRIKEMESKLANMERILIKRNEIFAAFNYIKLARGKERKEMSNIGHIKHMLLGSIHLNRMLTNLRLKLIRFYFLDIKIFNTDGDMKGIFSKLFQQKPMMKALSTGSLMQSALAPDGILPSGGQDSKLLQDNSRSVGNLDFEMMGLDSPGLNHGFTEDLVQSQILKTTKSEMVQPSRQTGGITPRKVTNAKDKAKIPETKSSVKPVKPQGATGAKPAPTAGTQPVPGKLDKAKPAPKEKSTTKAGSKPGPEEKKPPIPGRKGAKAEEKTSTRGTNVVPKESKSGQKGAQLGKTK